MQIREQPRAAIQMYPPLRLFKRVHTDANTHRRGLSGLQIQQQLPADTVGVVVEEFFQVEYVLSQPGSLHRRHHGPHSLLSTLGPYAVTLGIWS